MRAQRIVLRPAADLAAAGTFEIRVPCAGARVVMLRFRAADGNAPTALAAAEYGFENTGWLTAGTKIVESGDAIAGQTLNAANGASGGMAASTTAMGRCRRYTGPTDTGGYFDYPWFRTALTGHAANIITGLFIEALILGEPDPSFRA